MDFNDTPEEAAFRAEARRWLEANAEPANAGDGDSALAEVTTPEMIAEAKAWQKKKADAGWACITWPEEYGGRGATPMQNVIWNQEQAKFDAPRDIYGIGIGMCGPTILTHGTDAQKARWIPKLISGEEVWCQLFSEPSAGSDLAGLRSTAVKEGDSWVVNGQKIWTSYADEADWIFCLVRTDKENKYQGITFMLFDMENEGVSTKPIKLISGNSPFCETFFDDVKVPKSYGEDVPAQVGEVNRGWDVAKYLLGHEREMISGADGGNTGTIGAALARANGAIDPVLRAELAQFDVDALAYGAMGEKFLDEIKVGKAHPAQPNMMKYAGTELNKRRHELMMAAGGSHALEWESEETSGGKPSRNWLRTKANSIEGGTSEVMLNVISKRILDLPGA